MNKNIDTKTDRFLRFCKAFGLRAGEYDTLTVAEQRIVDKEYLKTLKPLSPTPYTNEPTRSEGNR